MPESRPRYDDFILSFWGKGVGTASWEPRGGSLPPGVRQPLWAVCFPIFNGNKPSTPLPLRIAVEKRKGGH